MARRDPNTRTAKAIRKVLADLGLKDQPVVIRRIRSCGAWKFSVETLDFVSVAGSYFTATEVIAAHRKGKAVLYRDSLATMVTPELLVED
jgi:hypothetical protein